MSFLSPSMLHRLLHLSELQFELIKLRSNDTQKAMNQNKPLLKFYRVYVSKEKFPSNLRASAHKCLSAFGNTHICKQFYYEKNITKSRFRSRLTGENFGMQLRVAISSVRPNTKR